MSTRKYMSEFGLNMCTGYRLLLQQDQLDKVDDLGFEPHIYIIGRRPRITIDPASVIVSEDRIRVDFVSKSKPHRYLLILMLLTCSEHRM
jgi:hypothetical protein